MGPKRQQQTDVPGQLLGWYEMRETLMGIQHRIRASTVTQTAKSPPAMQATRVRSLGWDDPLEEGMAPHSSVLAWRIPRAEEPGYSPWGRKESDTTGQLSVHGYNSVITRACGSFLFLMLIYLAAQGIS